MCWQCTSQTAIVKNFSIFSKLAETVNSTEQNLKTPASLFLKRVIQNLCTLQICDIKRFCENNFHHLLNKQSMPLWNPTIRRQTLQQFFIQNFPVMHFE